MDYNMPGFPVHCQLPELAQTHVHHVSDAIQPSHPVHGVLKARKLKWFAIPFSRGPHFVSTLHQSWVALHGMAHSSIELGEAVVHVINLVSFL